MAILNPPDYDNIRWGGPTGLRVPQKPLPLLSPSRSSQPST